MEKTLKIGNGLDVTEEVDEVSDSATDWRNLRMTQRPRMRREEKSARASLSPVRSASAQANLLAPTPPTEIPSEIQSSNLSPCLHGFF
ncbi:hypothetical protein RDI58_008119 [Solanum bulbocastanum]|uniref:Uncharacterized protein n=1 Tax=Solanum bulbocastanum TaxID=147425 RepID=A0AAN8YJV5_SOLBU